MNGYFNQFATWKRVTGYNEYGEPEFASAYIKVRWENKRQLTRNRQGDEIVSEVRAFCAEPVQPGDQLIYDGREWTVITVSDGVGLNGKVIFREVLC